MMKEKKQKLNALIKEYLQEGLILALSGGVDSTLLLALISNQAQKNKAIAITFESPLHPKEEIDIAKNLANKLNVKHQVISIKNNFPNELLSNTKTRCYACKKHLFLKAKEFAAENRISIIIDGTNSDDLKVYRPGKQAIDELGILSPLAIAGFTKCEIRKYADELNLQTAQRPSMPCLATRFPYDTNLDFDILKQINIGETFLRQIGFNTVRLRFHEPILRIEIEKTMFAEFIKQNDLITTKLKQLGFKYITLDMSGFKSGSFDGA